MHEKKKEESKEIEEIEKIKVVFVNCISEYPLP